VTDPTFTAPGTSPHYGPEYGYRPLRAVPGWEGWLIHSSGGTLVQVRPTRAGAHTLTKHYDRKTGRTFWRASGYLSGGQFDGGYVRTDLPVPTSRAKKPPRLTFPTADAALRALAAWEEAVTTAY
jgi:hypothetical protein